MKTLLQFLAVSLVLSSCSSLNQTGNKDLGKYDDVYATPADEPVLVQKKSEPSSAVKDKDVTKTPPAEERDYRKYKEGEPEEIVREPENYNNGGNYDAPQDDNYYYNDDDDFSYGRSFRRLRYGDGYRDGYRDGTYDSYNYGGGYYSSFYNDPYWGWNRPVRSNFWVGYNTWNGWNVGVNYGYPAWGWRTSFYPCYTNFYDPWYGYSGGWGYYSNPYYCGTPYGYYDPFYRPYYGGWGYYNSGYNGNRYNRPWYNQGNNNGSGYNGGKGRMTGPRETIGSNTPSKSRSDQVSPRSRGGMIQQNPTDGGTTYDPSKDKRNGMVGTTDPNATRGRVTDKGTNASTEPDNGNSGRTNASGSTTTTEMETPDNGKVTPNRGGTRTREIDRTTPDYGRSNEPSRGTANPGNSNSGRTSRGRSSETPESNTRTYDRENSGTRTYEQPKQERRTRTRSEEPAQNRSRGNDQPSNNNYQKREEPRNTPTPRSYDGGGNRGSSTPSGGRSNSGGSSTPPSRGRGR